MSKTEPTALTLISSPLLSSHNLISAHNNSQRSLAISSNSISAPAPWITVKTQKGDVTVLYNGNQLVAYDQNHKQLVHYATGKSYSGSISKYFQHLADSNCDGLLEDAKVEDLKDPGVAKESLNSGYYKRFFTQEKKLGAGSFGAVWLVRHQIDAVNLGYYALKKVPIGNSHEWLKTVLTEVKALEQLRLHPNIIGYKHSWLEIDQIADFGPQVPCLFILMEFANSGNLEDYVIGIKSGLSETEIWELFLDLLFGIDHLHSLGIIHRDIKGSNILLNREVDSHSRKVRNRVLISDFGTCAIKKTIGGEIRTGHTGTPEWIAPELLTKGPDGNYIDYNACCDMWGLGLCLHFMAFGKLPWKSTRNEIKELEEEITSSRIHFPNHIRRSQEILQLIRILLVKDPNIRPTARDLLLSMPIQSLLKKINDPQFDNLNAEIVVQGPHTRTFAERSWKWKDVPPIPLLPPSPDSSLNTSQNNFKIPIKKDRRLLFQILSFLYFTVKIISSSTIHSASTSHTHSVPLIYSVGTQFLAGLGLFLFKRLPNTYLFLIYTSEFIWTIFSFFQMDSFASMESRESFRVLMIQLIILSLGFILLYSDYLVHERKIERNYTTTRKK